VDIVQSCFEGGSSEYVVFVDAASVYSASLNYIGNDVMSDQCPLGNPGGRLFKEDAGSGCFMGSNTCTGSCLVVADQAECLAQGSSAPQQTPSQPSAPPFPVTQVPTATVTLFPTQSPPNNVTNGTVVPTPFPSITRPPSQEIPVVPTQKPVDCEYLSKRGIKGSSKIAKNGHLTHHHYYRRHKHCKESSKKAKGSKYFSKGGKGKGGIADAAYWRYSGKGYLAEVSERTFTSEDIGYGVGEEGSNRKRSLRIYYNGDME